MNERIDHAAEARRIIAEIPDNAGNATQQAWCTEALVHAQLAVAEQLRIGNLIALHAHEVKYDIGGARSYIYEGGTESVRPEIAAALGISDE